MSKGRLEAFSDGVIAILITIMVIEFHAPENDDWQALRPMVPLVLSYVLSFVYLGIYWNNHHHLLQASARVSGGVLWANLHLLFWLSLVPFATHWMGGTHFAKWPVMLYGFVLLMAAIAFTILAHGLARLHGEQSVLAAALGRDSKGWLSIALYVVGMLVAVPMPWIAAAIYASVAALWLIPDKRFERVLT